MIKQEITERDLKLMYETKKTTQHNQILKTDSEFFVSSAIFVVFYCYYLLSNQTDRMH